MSTLQKTSNKRKEKDVMRLLVSSYEVTVIDEKKNTEFIVKFCGPKDSAYEGVPNSVDNLGCLASESHSSRVVPI